MESLRVLREFSNIFDRSVDRSQRKIAHNTCSEFHQSIPGKSVIPRIRGLSQSWGWVEENALESCQVCEGWGGFVLMSDVCESCEVVKKQLGQMAPHPGKVSQELQEQESE